MSLFTSRPNTTTNAPNWRALARLAGITLAKRTPARNSHSLPPREELWLWTACQHPGASDEKIEQITERLYSRWKRPRKPAQSRAKADSAANPRLSVPSQRVGDGMGWTALELYGPYGSDDLKAGHLHEGSVVISRSADLPESVEVDAWRLA